MEPFSHTLTAQLHDQEHHVRLVFFEEKANAIFRSKKEKIAAGIFYFGPFRVALDLRVDVVNEIRQPNHPRDVPTILGVRTYTGSKYR